MPQKGKFTPPLKIDTLPVAYLQPDHLSPAQSPSRRSGSRGPSDDVRRRTPSASPGGASGGMKEYFPIPNLPLSTTTPISPPQSSTSGLSKAWRRTLGRIPLPPVLRRWLSSPLVLGIVILCLMVVGYRASHHGRYINYQPNATPEPFTSPLTDGSQGEVLDLPALPIEYTAHFPNLTLPLSLRTPTLGALPNRLYEFLLRPVLSHEAAKELMEAGCPVDVADGLVNPDQYKGNLEFWMAINEDEIRKRRAGIVKGLARVVERGQAIMGSERMDGQGIVLTGGGNIDSTLRTIALLKHLRNIGNDLPVEVFHFPGEMGARGERREMEELGAELREIEGVSKVSGLWKNFQIKGLALVQSKFREVIYMDSDNIPLRPLSPLFSSPSFLDTGAVFWPDVNKDHPHNAIWRIIGDSCDFSHWAFESGQMLIDKAGNGGLNLAALWIAAHMMSSPQPRAEGGWLDWGGKQGEDEEVEEGEEEREWWFHMTGGDKDTFRWAFRALDIPWSDPPRWLSQLGFENRYDNGRFCGHTTLQYDLDIPDGAEREMPLFAHGNLLKHMNAGGLGAGTAFTHVKRFKDDSYSNPDLNYAKGLVYRNTMRGMCLDFQWGDLAESRVSPLEMEDSILQIKVEDIEGKPFEGWPQAFQDMGGRLGGF